MNKSKLMMGVVIWGLAAMASAAPPPTNVVDVVSNPGSIAINQCVSVFGNCNNPDLTVNLNGDGDNTVWIDGKAVVVNGKDGKDGATGAQGEQGIQGIQGEQGIQGVAGLDGKDGAQGIAGINGADGKDGAAGAQGEKGEKGDKGDTGAAGKDADMSVVNSKADQSTVDNIVTEQVKTDAAQDMQSAAAHQQEATARSAGDASTLRSANSYTDSKFSQLNKMVNDNRDEARAGTSAALAASQIPQVSQGRTFSVGAGAGTYRGESAVAVGVSARFNERTVTKFAVTADTQSGFGAGAGISYEW